MADKPVSTLLSEAIEPALEPSVRAASELLVGVRNRGTKVFERVANPSIPSGDHTTPGMMFLRHILEMLDGMCAMVSHGIVDAALPQLRVQFESWLQLKFLVRANTEDRGYDYLVSELHRVIDEWDRLHPDSDRGKQFRKAIESDCSLTGFPLPNADEVTAVISEKRSHLLDGRGKTHESRYQATRAAIKKLDWYSIDPYVSEGKNIVGLEQLADYLKVGGRYQVFYRQWSKSVHSTRLPGAYLRSAADDRAATVALRNPVRLAELVNTATALALESFEDALSHYRPRAMTGHVEWLRDTFQPKAKAFEREWARIRVTDA